MSNTQTKLQATHPDGRQLHLSETTSDSPILPVAQLAELQKIDPALVQWVVSQTQLESAFRRSETTRVNKFIFCERISGVIAGSLVAIFGLGVAAYVAVNGHDWVAVAIGGATLATIVTVLVVRNESKENQDDETQPAPKNGSKRKK